jgi:hypothetical protein
MDVSSLADTADVVAGREYLTPKNKTASGLNPKAVVCAISF